MSHTWINLGICTTCGITELEYQMKFFPKCKGVAIQVQTGSTPPQQPKSVTAAQALELLNNKASVCKHNVNKYFYCNNCYIESLGQLKGGPKDKSTCLHSWKSYTGLSETFEYCEKCDQKR